MDAIFGEIAIGDVKNKSSLGNILWFNRVGDINNVGLGVNAQDNAFYNGNIGVSGAKIGGQCYYGIHSLLRSKSSN